MPRLGLALRNARGPLPDELRAAGGLGPRHAAALSLLGARGELTVGELAGTLGMSVAHASLVLGELARAELVERRPDPQDRRRTLVSAAPRALPAMARMRGKSNWRG